MLLDRAPIAFATVAVLAALVLLPGLGRFGFWEPQERQLADRAAPRGEVDAKRKAAEASQPKITQVSPAPDDCLHAAPPDALARSLQNRAPAWGRDHIDDSDGGRRFPLAILGLLTVLALAGTALRVAGPRAGLIAGVIALSFPLLTLQSRQLTSEIGTACGAALMIYGLVAARIAITPLGILDAITGVIAFVAGAALAFLSGGALLGLVVPLGAVAAAGAMGAPAVVALVRDRRLEDLRPLLVAIAAIALLALVAYQIYDLRQPYPGMVPPQRSIAGHVVAPSGCWSSALGAIWRTDDDLRYIYDSSFEQIAYGTFPWGMLAPIAMLSLLSNPDRRRRHIGALSLAWAGGAWIATELFQRKVGFTLWAGFPAIALALGVWIDDLLARRKEQANPATQMLIGLYFALAAIDLGKDLQGFAERATSFLIGPDAIAYPTQARLAFVPAKLWILILGAIIGLSFGVGLIVYRAESEKLRRWAARGVAVAFAATIALAGFWTLVWQPRLAVHLSSKSMFDMVEDLRAKDDQLVLMGDLGDAPGDYAHDFEVLPSREQIVQALKRPKRVFALAPQTELCSLHREIGGAPYYVLDDQNVRSILLSNRIDGAADRNPLAQSILHAEPKQIATRPKGRIVWDSKIQLLGWDIPKTVGRGERFEVKLYYKILASVGGAWTSLMHFDGALRFNGDHKPIDDRCPTSTWQPGDYIVDTYTVTAGGSAFTKGNYDLFIGFFTGTAPNWKNMAVTEAPGDMRDNATDRVKILQLSLD